MGDFSQSQNSKFTGTIKLKLTYLVPVFISLLLSQFQHAPLNITPAQYAIERSVLKL